MVSNGKCPAINMPATALIRDAEIVGKSAVGFQISVE
jgi:hypothetical protein